MNISSTAESGWMNLKYIKKILSFVTEMKVPEFMLYYQSGWALQTFINFRKALWSLTNLGRSLQMVYYTKRSKKIFSYDLASIDIAEFSPQSILYQAHLSGFPPGFFEDEGLSNFLFPLTLSRKFWRIAFSVQTMERKKYHGAWTNGQKKPQK